MHLLIHISKFHFQKVHSSLVIYTFLVVCERVHLPTPTIMGPCHSFFSWPLWWAMKYYLLVLRWKEWCVLCLCKEAGLAIYQSVDKRYGEKLLIGNNWKAFWQQKITYKIRDFYAFIVVVIPWYCHFWFSQLRRGILWLEAQGGAKHPPIHGTAPHNKEIPSPRWLISEVILPTRRGAQVSCYIWKQELDVSFSDKTYSFIRLCW